MNKSLKIILSVVVFLGIASGAFLLFAKKKSVPVEDLKTIQASAQVKSLSPLPAQQNNTSTPKKNPTLQEATKQENTTDRKTIVRSQWAQCKDRTIAANTNLLWSVQIAEGMPASGTYAKGNLDSDPAFPIHVIIKSDSAIVDKIKAMLVVGKTAFLRGTCTDVATDGAVVLQAF